jgi:hypothetical protein
MEEFDFEYRFDIITAFSKYIQCIEACSSAVDRDSQCIKRWGMHLPSSFRVHTCSSAVDYTCPELVMQFKLYHTLADIQIDLESELGSIAKRLGSPPPPQTTPAASGRISVYLDAFPDS